MHERDATRPQRPPAGPVPAESTAGLVAGLSQTAEPGGEVPRAPRPEEGILHGHTATRILRAQDLLAELGRIQGELRHESREILQAFLELAHAQDETVVGLHLFDEEDESDRTRIGNEFIRVEEGLEVAVDAAAVGLGAHAGELGTVGSFLAEDLHSSMLDVTFRISGGGEISYTQKWPRQE